MTERDSEPSLNLTDPNLHFTELVPWPGQLFRRTFILAEAASSSVLLLPAPPTLFGKVSDRGLLMTAQGDPHFCGRLLIRLFSGWSPAAARESGVGQIYAGHLDKT